MNRQPARRPETGGEDIRASLANVLRSAEFERSGRIRQLLEFLVETTLTGGGPTLKESVVAVRVFERDPSYDPKIDPVVRVAVGRLRTKLDRYYDREGKSDPIRIHIEKGTYVPEFLSASALPAEPLCPVPEPIPAAASKRAVQVAAVVLAIVAAGLAVFVVTRPRAPSLQAVRVLFASGGRPLHPSISPAGDMIAFDWEGPDDPFSAIYVQRMDGTSPVRLTPGKQAETWPVWSPDGKQIGFLRETRPDRAAVITVPLVGVGERVWFETAKGRVDHPRLDWAPNGKWFATAERLPTPAPRTAPLASSILLYSLANGERRTLTHPAADWRGDSEPVFSPDSTEVAFRRTSPQSGEEDIFRVNIDGGEPRQMTFDRAAVAALTYTPDRGIFFSSRRAGSLRNLWWIRPGGAKPQLISPPAFDLGSPTVSRDGRHLAYVRVIYDSNIWRIPAKGGQAVAVAPSEFAEESAAFSPDGTRIVFVSGRSGALELWTADVSGANAVRLTESGGDPLAAPQWSPDGNWIAFDWRAKGREGIYAIPSSGGRPRALTSGSKTDSVPRWSRDGRAVYFNSNRTGAQQIWRIPAEGGQAIQITQHGGSAATQSENAALLYYVKQANAGIWAMPIHDGLPAGPEFPVLPGIPSEDFGNWALAREGIYFIHRNSNSHSNTIEYFDLAARTSRTVHTLKAPPLWNAGGLTLSPDQTTILFAQVDHDGTSIYGR
jgi:Tol biopolymer transport system component